MSRKLFPWIAALLGLFMSPLAMLLVGRPWYALGFALASLAIGVAGFIGAMPAGIDLLLGGLLMVAGAVIAFRCARRMDGQRPWYTRWHSLAGMAFAYFGFVVLVRVFCYEPFMVPSSAMLPTLPLQARLIVQKYGFGHYETLGINLGKRPATAKLGRGDLVVFDFPRDPRQSFIKRVVALPGDRLTIRAKEVFVNGQDTRVGQMEDFLDDGSARLQYKKRYLNRLDGTEFSTLRDDDMPPFTQDAWKFPGHEACTDAAGKVECVVPSGQYFVMGDNRDNSFDSRYWGFVRADLVIGKVVKVFQ